MEDLIGFLVIGSMAILAIFNKIKESRESEPQKKNRAARRENLPDPTKRMLYGETGEIPTAKPRQSARPAPQRAVPAPTAQRQAPLAEAKAFRPQEQSRDTPTQPRPAPAPQRQAPRHAPRQRSLSPTEARRRVTRTLQQAWRQGQRQPAPQPQRRPQPTTPRVPRRTDVPPAAEPKPKKRAAREPLVANLQSIRRAIVMNEILGPPKGLQDL